MDFVGAAAKASSASRGTGVRLFAGRIEPLQGPRGQSGMDFYLLSEQANEKGRWMRERTLRAVWSAARRCSDGVSVEVKIFHVEGQP